MAQEAYTVNHTLSVGFMRQGVEASGDELTSEDPALRHEARISSPRSPAPPFRRPPSDPSRNSPPLW